MDDDIAVLRLSEPVEFEGRNEDIDLICTPPNTRFSVTDEDTQCWITGWAKHDCKPPTVYIKWIINEYHLDTITSYSL